MKKEKNWCFFVSGVFPAFLFKDMEKTNLFTAKKLCLCAIFCALAYAVSLLEIPVFAHIGLILDFSFCIMLLGGYMLGPVFAEIILIVVSLLGCIASSSFGIGQLANFLLANTFVIVPVIVYQYKKGLKNVIITLALSSLLTIGVALLCNRFIMYPLYFHENAGKMFNEFWYLIIIFNVLKSVLNSVITLLLYKRLKNILGFFNK